MTVLVYSAPEPKHGDAAALEIYLQAAAKIVETVAFEMATQSPSDSVEELLELACNIQRVANNLQQSQ